MNSEMERTNKLLDELTEEVGCLGGLSSELVTLFLGSRPICDKVCDIVQAEPDGFFRVLNLRLTEMILSVRNSRSTLGFLFEGDPQNESIREGQSRPEPSHSVKLYSTRQVGTKPY